MARTLDSGVDSVLAPPVSSAGGRATLGRLGVVHIPDQPALVADHLVAVLARVADHPFDSVKTLTVPSHPTLVPKVSIQLNVTEFT